MKKISAIICCALCIALLSLSAFALDIPLTVSETHNIKFGMLFTDNKGEFDSLFDPMTAAYGEPIYWGLHGDSPIVDISFDFSAPHVTYWIVPRYRIQYSLTPTNPISVCWYEFADTDVFVSTQSSFEKIGTKSFSPFTTAQGLTVYGFFDFYKLKLTTPFLPTMRLVSDSKDIGFLDFPVYAPKAYSSSDASSSWDSLNERIDTVNVALTAIGNKIDNINSTVERVLDEVAKQREFLEKPTPDAVSQGEHIDSELSRVQDDVSGALAAMSIPDVNFEPSNFVLPDDSNVTKNFLNWFSNLYPLNIILPAGVGLWAVYLIIHGVRSS